VGVDELDSFGGVEDDDAGPAADGLAVAQHVAPVAGDEGVVAGEQVGGEVLDVGDLVAVAGQRCRVGLVQASALELLGEDDLAQGEVGGGVVVVGESVGLSGRSSRPARARGWSRWSAAG
jgi:hypothetical protein